MTASSVPSPTVPSPVDVALDRVIGFGVRLPSRQEVSDYLASHPDVANLSASLCERARWEFPHGELELKVNNDPELQDPYLMLHARLWPYPPDMQARLDAVWAPFEGPLCDTTGWVVVSSDYRKPEGDCGAV